jgi:FKBP-type peptidyl-prolyl cis-trans isomerase
MITPARLALVLVLTLGLVAVACDEDDGDGGTDGPAATDTPAADGETPSANADGPPDVEGEPTVTASGLQIIDVEAGDGDEAVAGGTVTVHYSGWLEEDGTLFDSSVGGDPITFGLADLIPAWQEGIPGMKVGGTRRLIVPPELGYGAAGRGAIPPNATLVFDIELLAVE